VSENNGFSNDPVLFVGNEPVGIYSSIGCTLANETLTSIMQFVKIGFHRQFILDNAKVDKP
jgi:hypothetical protein